MTFRFTLRGLLLLIALFCMGIAWYAANARQRSAEERALAGIDRLAVGGRVTSFNDYCGTCVVGRINVESSAPRWLNDLLLPFGCNVFHRVDEVSLRDYGFDDRVLAHVATFTSLRKLYVRAPVTDTGLEHLTGLTNLQRIDLVRTGITAEGLRVLKNALPRTHIQVVDSRDIRIRSPARSRILHIAEDGTRVKRGDVLVTLVATESATQTSLYASHDGRLRYPTAVCIDEGVTVRERQIILVIQPPD